MYPHPIDRWRLLQFIFGRLQEAATTQKKLAAKTGISQPIIAALRHLVHENGELAPLKRSTRRQLLTACHALGLSHAELDAAAWLLDGQSMTAGEANLYVGRETQPLEYGDVDRPLRETVLYLLARAVTGENQTPEVRMHLEAKNVNSTAREAELKMFLEYERQPGQRLFASSIPSSLAHTDETFDTGSLLPPYIRGAPNEAALLSLYRQRREAFLHNLSVYGERSIHSKSSLKRYVGVDEGHHVPTIRRRGQIENCIRLLEENPHYQIGLTDDESLLELGVKLTPAAVIRGFSPNRSSNSSPLWGIHHIVWTDAESVFSFVLSFEHAWLKISEENREKAAVIRFLRSIIP
jgi:hypothetical protein